MGIVVGLLYMSFTVDLICGSLGVHELVSVVSALANRSDVITACDDSNSQNSFIYCHGKLLAAVNVHSIYPDSKTFVDMPMKRDPEDVRAAFDSQFGNLTIEEIKPSDLIAFLDEYFDEAGNELEECTPSDWVPEPKPLMQIQDPKLREWALELNAIWKTLCRKVKPGLTEKRHSFVHIPHEFIVPGGRFREFYYWDTYWTVKGLLASEMYNTTKLMILNLANMVQRYGFVPNGGRVYYLQRSQPPMLIGLVYEYYVATEDKEFLVEMLPILEKEFTFWQKNRTVAVRGRLGADYIAYQYRSNHNTPRPESYREDLTHATRLNGSDKHDFWKQITSAAESGWDFSTRWFADKKTITTAETTRIAPIDLNAFMCWNMNILQYLFKITGKDVKAKMYGVLRAEFRYVMHNVFYNVTKRAWFDFHIARNAHNLDFHPSVAVPLFAGCYMPLDVAKSYRLFKFLNESGAFSFPGGVPASLVNGTGEQWDFPNGWAPMNHMIIEGLRKSENPLMQEQAYQIARKWVMGNYKVYRSTGRMWEKYNVIGMEQEPGEGGEYDVQDGFGFTNGVILDLLTTYYNRMHLEDESLSGFCQAELRSHNINPQLVQAEFGVRSSSSRPKLIPYQRFRIPAKPIATAKES